jgi:hypothetical protein
MSVANASDRGSYTLEQGEPVRPYLQQHSLARIKAAAAGHADPPGQVAASGGGRMRHRWVENVAPQVSPIPNTARRYSRLVLRRGGRLIVPRSMNRAGKIIAAPDPGLRRGRSRLGNRTATATGPGTGMAEGGIRAAVPSGWAAGITAPPGPASRSGPDAAPTSPPPALRCPGPGPSGRRRRPGRRRSS